MTAMPPSRMAAVYPIDSLRVASLRGLRDITLEDLGRVNLLVGGTNSGKTTVLEAVSLTGDPLNPLTWSRAANRREPSPFAALESSTVDRLRVLFPSRGEESAPIEIALTGTSPWEHISSTVRVLRELRTAPSWRREPEDAPREEERDGLEVTVTVKERPDPRQLLLPDVPVVQPFTTFTVWEGEPLRSRREQSKVPVRIVTPYDHWLRSVASLGLSEATLADEETKVMALLRELEPRITGVRLVQTQREPSVVLRDVDAGWLPVSAFGDGIRRALTIALAVPRAAGGMLLIDEIETGLHVSMLRRVYRWLWDACRSFDVQLFATTHSLEALSAMLEADTSPEQDTVCFRLERHGDATTAKRFGEDQLRRLVHERGLDVR